jgi:hypothetical protein
VLAGLSLFATYWPASAIVVGVVAGARATGLDRKVWVEAKSLGRAVVARLRKSRAGQPPPPGPVVPASGAPQPRGHGQDGLRRGAMKVELPRPARRRRSPAEVSGASVRGPGD